MLDDIASTYARKAMYSYPKPFTMLALCYRVKVHSLDVTWEQFLRCGAFAACIKHYLMCLRPEELFDICTDTIYEKQSLRLLERVQEFGWAWNRRPEASREHVTLNVRMSGNHVVLRPRPLSVSDEEVDTFADFAERNRYWSMKGPNKDDFATQAKGSTDNRLSQSTSMFGKFWFCKTDTVDDPVSSGPFPVPQNGITDRTYLLNQTVGAWFSACVELGSS